MAEKQLELDCYHKAEPDEPKFTLLARDPVAASLIRMWAATREGNLAEMARQYAELVEVACHRYLDEPTDDNKLQEACAIAGDMEQWHGVNR